MLSFRLPSPLTVIALAVLTPSAIAEKNQADLSAFKGNFRGKAGVKTATSKFSGKFRVRGKVSGGNRIANLSAKGSVNARGRNLPVDNDFKFTRTGVVKIKELAPGDTHGTKVEGTYTATENLITFEGDWTLGATKGTIEGTVKVNNKGKLKLTYKVFVSGNDDPFYIYTYVGS